jgi:preprotein translocase subunit Sss1
MSTDPTAAITAVVLLIIGLTGMMAYMLSHSGNYASRA